MLNNSIFNDFVTRVTTDRQLKRFKARERTIVFSKTNQDQNKGRLS